MKSGIHVAERVAKLTAGQLECLSLVNAHLSSKEIADRLGISPHTVDQRMRQAVHTLGVQRRGEAARLVAANGGFADDHYQRLIHQSPHVAAAIDPAQSDGAVSFQIRHADRAGGPGVVGPDTEPGPAVARSPLPLPFATRGRTSNEMSMGMRIFWIFMIAIGSTFSIGMYLAGLESLSRLMTR